MQNNKTKKNEQKLRLTVTLVAGAAIIAHLIWPNVKIDAITLGLLALTCLPWLTSIIKSIEIPGVGKVELQALKDRLDETQGAIESISQRTDLAVSGTVRAESIAQKDPALKKSSLNLLNELAQEYDRIRETYPSGDTRTAMMTSVVSKMTFLAHELDGFDISKALNSNDRGTRLTGYAYLFARPDYSQIANLVDSLTKLEDKPFGQYWAIQAVRAVLSNRPAKEINENILRELRKFFLKLQPGTDRYHDLKQILENL